MNLLLINTTCEERGKCGEKCDLLWKVVSDDGLQWDAHMKRWCLAYRCTY